MEELIRMFQSLLSVMNPKEYDTSTIASCRPKVNQDTGEEYTYADITAEIASGTILQFGDKRYTFTAEPKGTPYTNGKTGVQGQLKGDKYQLNHVKTIDDNQLASVLG
jgi:hypothetical protein